MSAVYQRACEVRPAQRHSIWPGCLYDICVLDIHPQVLEALYHPDHPFPASFSSSSRELGEHRICVIYEVAQKMQLRAILVAGDLNSWYDNGSGTGIAGGLSRGDSGGGIVISKCDDIQAASSGGTGYGRRRERAIGGTGVKV